MTTKKISIIEPIGGHGGMDYYDYGLAFGLGQNKIKVEYFTSKNTLVLDFTNVKTNVVFGKVWKVRGVIRFYFFLKGYLSSFLISRKLNSEVFHFHLFNLGFLNLIVLFLASFFSQKKVVTLHDISPFHGKSNIFLEKVSMKLIDGIIVHNQSSKNELLKKNFRIPKIAMIPHGNYLPFVSMLPPPKHDGKIKLLFFGQIKEVKGLDVLLKAMAFVVKENPNFKLTIAGRPWKTDFQKYEKMITDLELVDFVETHIQFIEDEEVAALYEKADVVVLPYRHIYQSGVLLLTWSYGRTVIASNLDPFKELIINFENGFLFESENVEDLARCFLSLNRENILETTKNAANLIRDKYDWKPIGKQTLNFYKTL